MNGRPNRFSAIEASNLSNIHNNVVYVSGTMLEPTGQPHRGAILITGTEANSNVYGNIVQNYKGKAIKTEANKAHVNISHNLCHNNTDNSACSAANNGVIGDPKFVNTTGFALDVGSPAIDAGIATDYFDIDGSTQDIGIHGGPWGFDFYQSQLSDNTNPYLFPYFDQISLTSSGKVDINVLSVARFK